MARITLRTQLAVMTERFELEAARVRELAKMLDDYEAERVSLVAELRRRVSAPAEAEGEACKRCAGSGTYGEHGECFRCDGSGKDPGIVAGRTQFRVRRRQAAAQPARSAHAPRSDMAEAARRYCAEHGVASCTVEQARSML